MTQLKLYLNLPRYGLGNKLISWAKAYVWCSKNQAILRVKGWVHIPVGSILRGDKSLRWYKGFFLTKGSSYLYTLNQNIPVISNIEDKPVNTITRYRFIAIPTLSDLIQLKDERMVLKTAFFKMIKPNIARQIHQMKPPIVGIHIRRGDFVKIKTETNLNYFISIITEIRKIKGENLAVTIFSDGHEHELESILKLPEVALFKTINDLADLVIMSRSKILVTSHASSYSYWAAFISDGLIIHHPDSWVLQCRPEIINQKKFEGPIPIEGEWPLQLINNIKLLD
jgi:hypothetical protein